jgi:protein-disulfide isomerase
MRLSRRGTLLAGLALAVSLQAAGRSLAAREATDQVLGDPNAAVTIIEYASLTCPHCAAFHRETLPALKERYIDPGKVKLVFRDFPLDEAALRGAMLAHCAGPKRYFGFLDVLFRQQQSWGRASDPRASLTQLGKLGGMSEEEIQACFADKELEESILQVRLEAQQQHDVSSTPSFIIDGKTIAGGRSPDEMAQMIDPLLR